MDMRRENEMIPKIIHYCWFGRNELPKETVQCIESWKKYFPNYIIKECNEYIFDIKMCSYVEEAYNEKKWAFVSDDARVWILYNYGGVYFDTDVEVVKPLDDIVAKGAFMGCEVSYDSKKGKERFSIAPGLGIAAPKGMEIYEEILRYYEKLHFVEKDGSLNMKTVVSHVTEMLKMRGFDPLKKEIQMVQGICIYPVEYFCPINYITGEVAFTENTRTIHHYMSSWRSKQEIKAYKIRQTVSKKCGEQTGIIVEFICIFPYRLVERIERYGMLGLFKRILKRQLRKYKLKKQ